MSFFNFTQYKLDLSAKTYVMGILNLTPDSFSDGGKWINIEKALQRATEIEAQGADILDIGAQSTRPGFIKVSVDEEWKRLEPILKNIKKQINIPISIDTFYPEIAQKSLHYHAADIINDITGFSNPEMFEVVKKSNCGLIINHNFQGLNIKSLFEKKLKESESYNINPQRICFDPGIGFNKTRAEDAYIINNINNIKLPNIALMVGLSRKRVLNVNSTFRPPCERLSETVAANTLAIINGANIIRVHDIKENVQATQVINHIMRNNMI